MAEEEGEEMQEGTQVLGGFRLSPRLAMRVIQAVDEIQLGNIDLELSHISDDSCGLCRAAKVRGASHDAPETDRTRLARSA